MNRIKLLISIFATVLSLLLAGCEDSEDSFNNTYFAQPPLKYGSIIDGFEKIEEIYLEKLRYPFLCQKQKGKWFVNCKYFGMVIVHDISENNKVTLEFYDLADRQYLVSVYFNLNDESLAKIKKGDRIRFGGRMNSEGALSSCFIYYEYHCQYCHKEVYSIKDLGDDNMVEKYFEQFEKEEGICPKAPNIKHLKHKFRKFSSGIRSKEK